MSQVGSRSMSLEFRIVDLYRPRFGRAEHRSLTDPDLPAWALDRHRAELARVQLVLAIAGVALPALG